MKYLIILISLFFISCTGDNTPVVKIYVQDTGTNASFRALSVVDEHIAWISGTGGTVLRTIDGGKNWQDISTGVPDSIDFRDIEAFSEQRAVILSAGTPGLVMQTNDGGENWEVVYRDDRPEIFFDAMSFWDANNGIAFGDAIDRKIEIIRSKDGGRTWNRTPEASRPDALDGEGGFAASGTCLITYGDSSVWIALGIPESRVIVSHDQGLNWDAFTSPMAQATGSAGIFSLGFNDGTYGLAIGGDYRERSSTTKLLAASKDGGKSWQLVENNGLNGQKSAVTPIPGTKNWLCTGATGVNFSTDNGKTWTLVDTTGYYTIQMANKTIGFLSGPKGRVARISLH